MGSPNYLCVSYLRSAECRQIAPARLHDSPSRWHTVRRGILLQVQRQGVWRAAAGGPADQLEQAPADDCGADALQPHRHPGRELPPQVAKPSDLGAFLAAQFPVQSRSVIPAPAKASESRREFAPETSIGRAGTAHKRRHYGNWLCSGLSAENTYEGKHAWVGACRYGARVELSAKVLDDADRLERTLAHELCHVAAWLLDHVAKPPHGKVGRGLFDPWKR